VRTKSGFTAMLTEITARGWRFVGRGISSVGVACSVLHYVLHDLTCAAESRQEATFTDMRKPPVPDRRPIKPAVDGD
jgi:hypothetical protein